jgi:hypothetical protein
MAAADEAVVIGVVAFMPAATAAPVYAAAAATAGANLLGRCKDDGLTDVVAAADRSLVAIRPPDAPPVLIDMAAMAAPAKDTAVALLMRGATAAEPVVPGNFPEKKRKKEEKKDHIGVRIFVRVSQRRPCRGARRMRNICTTRTGRKRT